MTDALPLASRLRGMSATDLSAVVRARDIRPGALKDFFDLADALLERDGVQVQLSRLDRPTLAALAAVVSLTASAGAGAGAPAGAVAGVRAAPIAGAGAGATESVAMADVAAVLAAHGAPTPVDVLVARLERASKLMLINFDPAGSDGAVVMYRAVAEQLRSWPAFGLPSLAQLAGEAAPAALESVSAAEASVIDRIAAEHAFAAVTEISELLAELERGPARELAKGGVALPDSKRLANAMSVDLDTVPELLTIAIDAGLVARSSGTWCTTDAGGDWMLTSTAARWAALASGWIDRVPADIRSLLGDRAHALWSEGLRAFVEWLYPAAGDWISGRIAAVTHAAERLGVTANQAPSTPGGFLVTSGTDAAAVAMAALLPREVDRVYLQHDLSVVAPGPLVPELDARLRTLADVESRALASTWRISTSSMNRAMAAGETADSLRNFLGSISLTGIPQPLDYLIGEASRRYGLIRVRSFAPSTARPGEVSFDARTVIASADDSLLGTIMVDQSLSSLALARATDGTLLSRYPLDTVFWNLSDARYPVAAEDADGNVVVLQRRMHARQSPASGTDPVDELIERLRLGSEAQPEETEGAWLARQLDSAIRAKVALTVSIRMPNGNIVEYQLEPASVSGGRLRARDRKSAIERTLPVSSIAGVGPAQEP